MSNQVPYQDFLRRKIKTADSFGFEVPLDSIHKVLYPHQRDIVHYALMGGRRAIFGQFGLGKTLMQLEVMEKVRIETGKPVLIGLPLGVKQEFEKDAKLLGYEVKYIREQEDITDQAIYLSNYERIRDGKFIPETFGGVSFDEASVIRSMGTQTTQYILTHFKNVRYRYVFTATPSPNEYHELLKYADFLGIMDIGQALNRFFKRDSVKAHNSSLLEHREKDFWHWVHSWAVFATKPSDINPEYSDAGYDLPELKIIYHEVKVKERSQAKDRDGNPVMFNDPSIDLSSAAREKRESMTARMEAMREIVKGDDHWIIWHHLEDERKEIEKTLDKVVSVYGSQSQELKERNILGFSAGEFKYLATKPEIAGSGCNFQYHCHKAIFLGINYQFNDFIQAVHRIYRFQQNKPVEIHILYSDTEHQILKALKAKWQRHNLMVEKMVEIIRECGLNKINVNVDAGRSFNVIRKEVKGEKFTAINNDSVIECSAMPNNSVDLIVSSIPFSDLFEYSESYNDMGQSNGDEEFFAHLDYLTPQLLRILKPGRIAAIHVKDCIKYSYQNGAGFTTLNPFSDSTAAHFMKHGFYLTGRITIDTDVVQENAQTYRLGWTEQCKDGTKMSVGLPEYILIFRKAPSDTTNAYADEPVVKAKEAYTRARWQLDAHAHWKSNGDRFLSSAELRQFGLDRVMAMWKQYDKQEAYDYQQHVRVCEELDSAGKLPVKFMALPPQSRSEWIWDDILRINTLNVSQAAAKKIKHVCPLQIDVTDRCIERWSNPGETVLDPFGGIGTVAVRALELDRRGITIDLSEVYWTDSCSYLKGGEYKKNLKQLF